MPFEDRFITCILRPYFLWVILLKDFHQLASIEYLFRSPKIFCSYLCSSVVVFFYPVLRLNDQSSEYNDIMAQMIAKLSFLKKIQINFLPLAIILCWGIL